MSRIQKQLLIGGIYILIAAVIGGSIYWSEYQPTCSDAVKNGKEEGVDCGTLACGKACEAPVQALIIRSIQTAIEDKTGSQDVVVQVYNPNAQYGVAAGTYDITFQGADGKELKRISAIDFYMLPGQTKYLVRSAIPGIQPGATVKVEIKSVEWEKVTASQDNPFIITREALSAQSGQAVYEAVISNNSNFDFDTVDVAVVVYDDAGHLLTASTTNFQTLLSHTDRSIKVIWPFALPANARVQAEVGTNVFDNANFLKTKGGAQEKFQQYY